MDQQKTKKCPYCGEEILAVAKKCKHCGEWLENEVQVMKACPVCGEMIDANLTVCPHCDELTHFSDIQTDALTKEHSTHMVESTEDDKFLYCKSCKAKLHMDSESCNSCGDNDPFYFKKIKRFENISCWGAAIVILGLLYFANAYMGFRLNISPAWLEFVCFMVIYIILFGIIAVIIRRILFQSYIRDYESVMHRLFGDVGHPSAINSWKAKVDKILY